MSPTAGPEVIVNATPLQPEATGLLQTLQELDGDDRMIGGIRHRPENYSPIVGVDPSANVAIPPIYTSLPPRVGRAIIAQEIDEASAFGWEEADYEGRATRGLLAKESIFLETELEQGLLVPENPRLAAPGTFAPADIAVGAGGTILTSAGAGFRAYMEGWQVTGPYWGPGVTVVEVLSDTQVRVSATPRKIVSVTTTAAGTALVATAGTFDTVRDVGAQVGSDNPNIPAGRTLATVTDATHAALNSGTGVTAAVGVPTTITPVLALSGLTVTFTDPGFVQCAGGQPVSPQLAIAYLNQAIADAGIGMGLIHLPAFLGERIYENRGVVGGTGASPANRFFSVNGNPVIIGNGYKGVGPDGSGGSPTTAAPAGTVYQWAYATDLMQVIRPPKPTVYPNTFAAALDRSVNLVAYRASRPFAINWSGLLRAAVKVAVTT